MSSQHRVKSNPQFAEVLEKWTFLLTVSWSSVLLWNLDLDTGPVARLKSWAVSCISENPGCGKSQWRLRGAVHPSPLSHRQKGSWTWSAKEVMRTPKESKVTLLLRPSDDTRASLPSRRPLWLSHPHPQYKCKCHFYYFPPPPNFPPFFILFSLVILPFLLSNEPLLS